MASIKFESETSVEERRKARQAEWEKVRKESDPVAAPEEEVCNKSLYEQLKENKDKKEFEFDESRKFKNHFRGLEEDETTFLAEAETIIRHHRSELDSELKTLIEENKNVVIENLKEPDLITPVVAPVKSQDDPQKKLLLKKKGTDLKSLVRKRTSTEGFTSQSKVPKVDRQLEACSDVSQMNEEIKPALLGQRIAEAPGLLSLACYDDSSDSDS